MTALGDLRVRDVRIEACTGAVREPSLGIALRAAMGDVVVVPKHARELVGDMRSAVTTARSRGSRRIAHCHGDHLRPTARLYSESRSKIKGVHGVGGAATERLLMFRAVWSVAV